MFKVNNKKTRTMLLMLNKQMLAVLYVMEVFITRELPFLSEKRSICKIWKKFLKIIC